MIIGVPKEIKNNEYRVALMPSGVKTLVENNHKVLIQKSAGEGSSVSDAEYLEAGAVIVEKAEEIFRKADMILKVKEPLPPEFDLLREDQVLFTYLHLAPSFDLTNLLLEKKIIGIGYETVQLANGSLPLLTPMSEIAGKLAVQVGAHYLEKENGGRGVLLGGVTGTRPANVVVAGGGTVGLNAAKVALGMGANVILLDINVDRLRVISNILEGRLTLLVSNSENMENSVRDADVVVGALLIPGARATKVITRYMVSKMRRGSVIVDVAIDQGGCAETSAPTSFDKPTFTVHGVIHYCVENMPSCVSNTSTLALTNATFPYVLELANLGYQKALAQDIPLRKGLNIYKGKLTNQSVAEAVKGKYTPYEEIGY